MPSGVEVEAVPLARGLKIASPYPAVLIEGEATLVAADLHLGVEREKEELGVHIPAGVFPKIRDSLLTPFRFLGCSRLILLGDVKHEFGRPLPEEWWGVKRLVKLVREAGGEVEVVRGNHDNYIIYILKELGVKLYEECVSVGAFTLAHGHNPPTDETEHAKHLIIGHEHPVVSVKDDVGVKHRFKAFLTGRVGGKLVTVLPSVSPIAYGSDVNETLPEDRLSPYLRNQSLDDVTPYLIEVGVAVKRFPKLKHLTHA